MFNRVILGLVESVIGKGRKTAKSNYAFFCPFCGHKKTKLEINLETNEKGENQWHCWACDVKGKTIESLFKRLKVSSDKLFELRTYMREESGEMQGKTIDKRVLSLPKEFISLQKEDPTNIYYTQAMYYLRKRGISIEDIIKYNIGYCEKGKYANKIIIPSYDQAGMLNYFIARSFEKDPIRKYDAPSCDKNKIIGFENTINWNVPVILCEGAFDAIAIKRNVIPLFGKIIPVALKYKLIESHIKTVYIALDKDAIKTSLKYAQELVDLGKEVYLLDLEGKDPSELGFKKFTEQLYNAVPLTFRTFLSKKLNLYGN